jgi:glyoxalase family protein
MADILGIHHMTALSGPAQENLDFYSDVLGLRLVKLTVNFDDPGTYHLYYGDASGTPGTILTFFPYPNGYPGRPGAGQATVTTLSVPPGSMPFWVDRFRANEVDFDRPLNRGGMQSLAFRAPDGLLLELAASPDQASKDLWTASPVPTEARIGGIRSVTLVERDLGPTETILTDVLGFRKTAETGNRHRFEVAEGGAGKTVEVVVDPTGPSARGGHGSVHHIAFRVADDVAQAAAREELESKGFTVSQIRDRDYFRSIYFREPGGVLFEIATDTPGFTVDEPLESLGTALRLPKSYEAQRGQIQRVLPPLKLPTSKSVA